MNENTRWLKLTREEIINLIKHEGISISHNIVRKLLRAHKFVKRKMLGKIRCGNFEDRDKQFNVIHAKLEKFKGSLNPVLSMDTKKKESLGRLYRPGKVYCTRAVEVHDHTNDSLIQGTIVPMVFMTLR